MVADALAPRAQGGKANAIVKQMRGFRAKGDATSGGW
jgi:hypothetical protein